MMWDGVHNKELTRLVEAFWEAEKPVAACSQGTAALLDATVATKDGRARLLQGLNVSCLLMSGSVAQSDSIPISLRL